MTVYFDWYNYLTLAEELAEGLPEKPSGMSQVDYAAVRTIISRAYYAAYWRCKIYLQNKSVRFPLSGEESHLVVVDKLKELGGVHVGVSSQLNTMRKQRRIADYDSKIQLKKDDAVAFVGKVKTFIDWLNSL